MSALKIDNLTVQSTKKSWADMLDDDNDIFDDNNNQVNDEVKVNDDKKMGTGSSIDLYQFEEFVLHQCKVNNATAINISETVEKIYNGKKKKLY